MAFYGSFDPQTPIKPYPQWTLFSSTLSLMDSVDPANPLNGLLQLDGLSLRYNSRCPAWAWASGGCVCVWSGLPSSTQTGVFSGEISHFSFDMFTICIGIESFARWFWKIKWIVGKLILRTLNIFLPCYPLLFDHILRRKPFLQDCQLKYMENLTLQALATF